MRIAWVALITVSLVGCASLPRVPLPPAPTEASDCAWYGLPVGAVLGASSSAATNFDGDAEYVAVGLGVAIAAAALAYGLCMLYPPEDWAWDDGRNGANAPEASAPPAADGRVILMREEAPVAAIFPQP